VERDPSHLRPSTRCLGRRSATAAVGIVHVYLPTTSTGKREFVSSTSALEASSPRRIRSTSSGRIDAPPNRERDTIPSGMTTPGMGCSTTNVVAPTRHHRLTHESQIRHGRGGYRPLSVSTSLATFVDAGKYGRATFQADCVEGKRATESQLRPQGGYRLCRTKSQLRSQGGYRLCRTKSQNRSQGGYSKCRGRLR